MLELPEVKTIEVEGDGKRVYLKFQDSQTQHWVEVVLTPQQAKQLLEELRYNVSN